MPVQMPIAFGRSSAEKTFEVTERVEGTINAPPMPIPARSRIRTVAEGAKALASEPMPKMISPTSITRRRP